jgi:diguanylate cyclase
MPKSYNYHLVVLSVLVAVFVSNTALSLFGRLSRDSSTRHRWTWILGGGMAMGCGIWATHFLGMLALSMPIRLTYNLATTAESLALAIGASVVALLIAFAPRAGTARLLGSASLLGGGIASMHYLGMSAIQILPGISNNALLVLLSGVVAVAGSFFALWILFRQSARFGKAPAKAASAVVLGLSIGGMHYIGLWAARFSSGAYCIGSGGVDNSWLAIVVGTIAFALMAVLTILLAFDAHLDARKRAYHADLESANKQLEHAATHDALTGLPNRMYLSRRLNELIDRPARPTFQFAVVLIDLDRFKEINDSLGHQAGDQLLCTLSERLASQIRESDFIVRLGGDEFVVVADGLRDEAEANLLASRLQAIIAQPVTLCDLRVHVTASIGIALGPGTGMDAAMLLQRADAAMYHVKNAGRRGSKVFSQEVQMPSRARLETEDGLRRALNGDELELHYDAKVNVRTKRIEGAEALIRWHHPQRGLLLPEEFVTLAEETGLIVPLNEWILREACRQIRAWQPTEVGAMRVAINVSAQQFQRGDFVDLVRRVLRETAVDPSALELELTETAVMRDPESSFRALRRLTDLGVSIALDNFGTGYSSLDHLSRCPLVGLKIDRSFIQALATGERTSQIFRAIVALAHNLNLDVVAEGVETMEQLRFLREIGCDRFQGSLFSLPLPATDFAARVIESRTLLQRAPAGASLIQIPGSA